MVSNKITDPKKILWRLLYDEFNKLMAIYPDKVKVKVYTAFPQEMADIEKYDLIVISRTSVPEETRFMGDIMSEGTGLNIVNQSYDLHYGNLQTEYYQISILTLNPQTRDNLYRLTIQLLFENKDKLFKQQFYKFIQVNAQDVDGQQERYLPRTVYQASITYMTMFQLQKTTIDELISDIIITTYLEVPSGDLNYIPVGPYHIP